MRRLTCLLTVALLFAASLPAHAAETSVSGLLLASADSTPALADSTPVLADEELVTEHQRFTNFAQNQLQRMNATIIGGRSSMRIYKGSDGMYHASYKAIDENEVVCKVSRAKHDPRYFVGTLVYKELMLESVARTADACRKGSFEPVSATPQRVIYSSKRGGGWN